MRHDPLSLPELLTILFYQGSEGIFDIVKPVGIVFRGFDAIADNCIKSLLAESQFDGTGFSVRHIDFFVRFAQIEFVIYKYLIESFHLAIAQLCFPNLFGLNIGRSIGNLHGIAADEYPEKTRDKTAFGYVN